MHPQAYHTDTMKKYTHLKARQLANSTVYQGLKKGLD